MKRLLLALVLTAAVACDDAFTAIRSDVITARAEGSGVRIASLVDEPVYYFVADRQSLALLDWVPCTDPAKCRGVPAHGSVVVPPEEIAGNQPGSHEVTVYHWLLVRSGSGWRPDSIRGSVVAR